MSDIRAKSISIITLGVADLERSVRFYEALGWDCSPDSDAACTYMLSTNVVLGLVPHDRLAREIGFPLEQPLPKYNGVLLAINGSTQEELDAIYEKAVAAGATVQQKPVWKDWDGNPGYSGFILDPDGYVWELAYFPGMRLGEDNRLIPHTPEEGCGWSKD